MTTHPQIELAPFAELMPRPGWKALELKTT